MFKYHILLFFRQLSRQKLFSTINILGLSVGIGSSLLIYLYIQHELSFDRFHDDADRIYRINQTFLWGEGNETSASTGPGVAFALAEDIPEFESITRVHPPGRLLVTIENEGQKPMSFDEQAILAVDSSFFSVFSFCLLSGNKQSALDQPNAMVLTESTARRYFGTHDPMGRLVRLKTGDTQKTVKVTGVVQNPPDNSHLQFDILLSMKSIPEVQKRNWSWIWTAFVTFGKLSPGSSPDAVREKLVHLPKKYAESTVQRAMGMSFQEYISGGKEWKLYLQPLTSVHLYSTHIYNRLNEVGNIKIIYALGVAVLFIIILSCINFMNLTTAQYMTIAKSNTVRKILGSSRFELGLQQLVLSGLFCLTAVLVGGLMAETMIGYFNSLSGSELGLNMGDPSLGLLLVILLMGMTLLTGSYPAFFLSAFETTSTLKGQLKTGKKGRAIRNGLVVFQFTLSILLMICTLVVNDQLVFLANKDLGFKKENLVALDRSEWLKSPGDFVDHIENLAGVQRASWTTSVPPRIWNGDQFKPGDSETKSVALNYVKVDENFLPTMGLPVILGRNFETGSTDDQTKVILNEQAVRALGWKLDYTVLDQEVKYPGMVEGYRVLGVVRDFNYWSLSGPIEPLAIFHIEGPQFANPNQYVLVRLSENGPGSTQRAMKEIKEAWQNFAGELPFKYEFVDHAFAVSHNQGNNFRNVLSVFTSLSIFIAGLGLLGLVIYSLEQRSKEIGIRKVLGATLYNIFSLISWHYIRLVMLSFVLSAPLALVAMESWLQDYEYRIDLSAATFMQVGLFTLGMALAITGLYSTWAARINPVETLKDE